MIYDSPFPLKGSYTICSVWDHFLGNPNFAALDKTYLIDAFSGKQLTYRQVKSTALKLGHGLLNKAKLKANHDAILIFSPNSINYPAGVYGGQAAGLTVSTANSSYTAKELAHQIKDSGAKLLLIDTELVDIAIDAAQQAGISKDMIFAWNTSDGQQTDKVKSWETLFGNEDWKPAAISEKEAKSRPAYLPYSSGTTGLAKGVEISHFNITSVVIQAISVPGFLESDDILTGVLPFYHIYGLLVFVHAALSQGATVVVMPKFDLVKYLESVQKYKINYSHVVPPIALGLAKHPIVDKYDLSSLKTIFSGAAPLSPELSLALSKRLNKLVIQGYGMTETVAACIVCNTVDKPEPGSVGKLIAGMKARIVDSEGKDVAEGKEGELWVSGNNIMMGYHNNDKATKETLTSDRWLKTGDVVIKKGDWWYIVDRTKELIKYKGFQVAPAELEALLINHDLIDDAAVIGVYSEDQATELPRAYIVPNAKAKDQKDFEASIVEYVESKVAPHKRLRGGVHIIDVIPKSAAGKILRKDLRAKAASEIKSKAKL